MVRARRRPIVGLCVLAGLACGETETQAPVEMPETPFDPVEDARLATQVPYADEKYAATGGRNLFERDLIHTLEITSNVPGIRTRQVVVVLPPDYFEDDAADHRYPVVYMQDGDNVLDVSAFGHGGWEIHEASRTMSGVTAEPVIFVAPHNAGDKRRAEYTWAHADTAADGATPEKYLDYLQYNVMPYIDARYRTQMDARSRGIGGSSSGAILALYGAWTRPNVYRRVMALSTYHWDMETFIPLVDGTESKPRLHKVYLDSGSPDDGVDEMNEIAAALERRGFVLGSDMMTYIGEGHPHNERSWRLRFPIGFEFTYPLAP